MIEKDAGNPMIHRLCIIHSPVGGGLQHSPTNYMNELTFSCCRKMGFNNDQWGNRKTKNANDFLPMKLFSYESMQKTTKMHGDHVYGHGGVLRPYTYLHVEYMYATEYGMAY